MQFPNCITIALPLTPPKNGVNTTFSIYGNASNTSNAVKVVYRFFFLTHACENLRVYFFSLKSYKKLHYLHYLHYRKPKMASERHLSP